MIISDLNYFEAVSGEELTGVALVDIASKKE